jgi:16S rRNA (uracil1498-N3)-methyltransferase
MPDFRVFCPSAAPGPAGLTLSASESHHLVAVNRARVGDPVVAFDGRGTEWSGELAVAARHGAVLRVRSTRCHPPLPHAVTLGQALPKGPAMDAIVRHATELGVARLVPLESERTQVHLEGDRSDRKVEKWQTVALEAAKQCGNPFLPEILPLQKAAAFIATDHACDLKLVASLHPGAGPLRPVFAAFRATHGRPPRRVVWLIGPEGDLSPGEVAHALAHGFVPITLGPLVLRCDTAATCALSVTNYELQALAP